jgi:hypothetical protein
MRPDFFEKGKANGNVLDLLDSTNCQYKLNSTLHLSNETEGVQV